MATKKPTTTKKPATNSAATAKRAAATARTEAAKAKAEAVKARAEAAKARAARLTGGHGSGFMNFIREQGVIGLAVGLAIGTAAGDTVKKLVQAFIDPVVQLLIGSQEGLQTAKFVVEIGDREGEFMWGAFVSSLITLLATAFVIYLIIHFMKLDKLDKKKQ